MKVLGCLIVDGSLLGICWQQGEGYGAVFAFLLFEVAICTQVYFWSDVPTQDSRALIAKQLEREARERSRMSPRYPSTPGPHGFERSHLRRVR